MNLLVIGGSNSKNSINRKLAQYTASLFTDASTDLIDISKMDLPLYSIDKEYEKGIPDLVIEFANKIDKSDFILLSLAENNGSFNVGFKNLIAWTSRIKDRKIFGEKPMLLMATSPGARGGATVLENAKNLFSFWGANVKNTFSLPKYYQNFDDEKGITNLELLERLKSIINNLEIK